MIKKIFSLMIIIQINLLALSNCVYKNEYSRGSSIARTGYDYTNKVSSGTHEAYNNFSKSDGWRGTSCSNGTFGMWHFERGSDSRASWRGGHIWNERILWEGGVHLEITWGWWVPHGISSGFIAVSCYKQVPNTPTCPSGWSNNGSNCKKAYTYYNYTCSSAKNSQGFNWAVSNGGGTSSRSSTPPSNNCSRKYQECDASCPDGMVFNQDDRICTAEKYYDYPMIVIGNSQEVCDSYKATYPTTSFDTESRVLFADYDFSSIGITQSQVDNKEYCIIGEDKIAENDLAMKNIKKVGNISTYILNANMNKPTCEKYSKCFPSDITTNYANESELKQCSLKVDENAGVEVEPESTIPDYVSRVVQIPEDITGSFAGEINGYKDIFTVQEFSEGAFGYLSNYIFRLPQNNIIKIGGREVSPINKHSPIAYPLKYDFDMLNHTQKTRNKAPTEATSEASGFLQVSSEAIGEGLTGIDGFDTINRISDAPYAMIFGKRQIWGWYESDYKIYQDIDLATKYTPNIYGYDSRKIEEGRLSWWKETLKTGTHKGGEYLKLSNSIVQNKKDTLVNMGYPSGVMDSTLTTSVEKNIKTMGFPSPAKKWGMERIYYRTDRQEAAAGTNNVKKDINTVFLGATNSVSIVVPYLGDYELKAYDAGKNLLATRIILEKEFLVGTVGSDGSPAQTYAKVQFAKANDYNVAPGQDKKLVTGSCISSDFVEWGGGVSGAYYEEGVPDIGLKSDCLKSNDQYVKDHSAVKITLRATNASTVFGINLKKPMPYPNRVRLVNLMKNENRKYLCYGLTEKCTVK